MILGSKVLCSYCDMDVTMVVTQD